MAFNIDIAIVALFLVFTMIIGFGHGRKVQTIQDYALGGRDFSTAALVATIVATYATGSGFIITIDETYFTGFSYVFSWTGIVVYFILVSHVLVPRMHQFLGKVSIAELMGDLYGNKIRLITAIAGAIGSVGSIAVQFKVFSHVASYFTNISPDIALILSGIIVTTYSAFGGIRAVTFTDIFQFFTFGVIMPVLGFLLWNKFCLDNHSLNISLQNSKFDLGLILDLNNPEFIGLVVLFLYFCIPSISPTAFQRIAMGRSIQQVQKAFFISSIVLLFLHLSISWIGFLLNSINPELQRGDLVTYMLDNYSFVGLRGLIASAIIAFSMSTADSRINSSSVLFSHDIYNVLSNSSSTQKEILVSRLFAFTLGGAAIFFALVETNLFKIVLLANSFYYPIVTPIFLLTILGFRSSTKSVLIGMFAGFMFVIYWKIYPMQFSSVSSKVVGIILAMLLNTFMFLLSHYLLKQPGGWIQQEKKLQSVSKPKIFGLFSIFKGVYRHNEDIYVTVGLYLTVYSITTMYSTHLTVLGSSDVAYYSYLVMLIISTIIATYPIWPLSLGVQAKKNIMRFFWPISIIFMLTVLSSFFVLISNFSLLQTTIAFVNIMVISCLLDWKASTIFISLGYYIGYKMYTICYGEYILNFNLGSPELIVFYVIILSGLAIIMFIRPQQEYQEATEAKVEVLEGEVQDLDSTIAALQDKEIQYQSEISSLNEAVDHYSERVADQAKEIERLGATAQKILNNVNHELRLPVGNVMNFAEMLYEGLGNYSQEQLKELTDEVYQNSTRLSTMILNMLDLATLDVKKVGLVKSTENFSELVRDRVKICRNIYLQGKAIDFKLIIEPEILISIDPNYMRQVVDNLVINAINFSEKGTVEIEVRRNDDAVVMTLRDQGKGIPREELFDIFKPFKMGSNSECQSQGRGVGLALCKSAVEAHGGSILAESPGGIGALFTIILMR